MTDEKQCTKCGEIKPLLDFYTQRYTARKTMIMLIKARSQCRDCTLASHFAVRQKRNHIIRSSVLDVLRRDGAMTAKQIASKINYTPHVIGAQAREIEISGEICKAIHPYSKTWVWHLPGQFAEIKIRNFAKPKKSPTTQPAHTSVVCAPAVKDKIKKHASVVKKKNKKMPQSALLSPIKVVSNDKWFKALQAEVAAKKKALAMARSRA